MLCAVAVFLLLVSPAFAHRPGCRSPRCDHRVDVIWGRAHPPPLMEGLASWYEDGGATACGTHARLGVAHLALPCGTRLRICHVGCEIATVDDRGPYIAGRVLDLNAAAKAAIGCSDLCRLTWGVAHG